MFERKDFATKDELAVALADAVEADLARGIAERGTASLVVSGGSTPGRFFARLGKRKTLDWSNVIVTLVDERWVHETSDRSNAGLVNETLLQGPAANARFIPLYSGGDSPDKAAILRTNTAFKAVPRPFDAVVLGMGSDGHTASFFPDGDTLKQALTGEGPVLAIRAPGAGEPRVTLTLRVLLEASSLYLHIEGEEKAGVLEKALGAGPLEAMPIRAVLRSQHPLTVFWCP